MGAGGLDYVAGSSMDEFLMEENNFCEGGARYPSII